MGLFMATQFLRHSVLCEAPGPLLLLFHCRLPSLSSSFCSQTKHLRTDLLLSHPLADSLKLSGSYFINICHRYH